MNPYPLAGSVPAAAAEMTLRDLVNILRRRRRVVILVCIAFVALAAVKCIFGTRRYESSASIQIQKEESDSMGIESALGSAAEGASDALDYNITLQTQAKILASDTLALDVIQEVGLEQNDDFTGKGAWFRIPAWLTPWNSVDTDLATISLENSPGRRRRALKTFAKRLKIQIEPGTRLIKISFLSTEPKTAADVVNRLIRDYTEYTYKTRFAATAQVSDWLSGQLHGLQMQAEEAQAKKVRLQSVTGLFGDDEQNNVVLARLVELNSAVTKAESDRILAQTLDHVASTRDADLIDALGPGSSASLSSGTSSSLALVQQLRSRKSELDAALSQSLEKFGPNYPQVLEQKAQLQSIQKSIQEEVGRLAARAHSGLLIAQKTEDETRRNFDRQKALLARLGRPTLDYTMAKQEADAKRDLYESLSTKLAEASVLSGLRSSNITVVDPARPSAQKYPKQPNIPVTLAAGLLVGLILGSGLAFASDFRDTRIHSVAQIEQMLGAAPLAILPNYHHDSGTARLGLGWLKTFKRLEMEQLPQTFASIHPDSTYAEALRSLRTSLMLSRSQGHPKVILITSALPGEGKSTTALNLATILGQQGGRVLIVDGDMRRPTLHQKLRMDNHEGLSSLLSLEETTGAVRAMAGPEDIWILTTGPRPPYPAELLGSVRMDELLQHWRANFDFVIIDTPPVLPVTDAVLLSERADAVLLVARYHVSTRWSLQRAHTMLTTHGESKRVGVILNGVERASSDYAEYYGYTYQYNERTSLSRGVQRA